MPPNVIITGGGGAGAKGTARLSENTVETYAEPLMEEHREVGVRVDSTSSRHISNFR